MKPLNSDELDRLDHAIGSLSVYLKATKTMYNRFLNGQIRYIEPTMVTSALALEKSLKALISFVDQRRFPYTHDLQKLLDELSEETTGYLILLSGVKFRHFDGVMQHYQQAFTAWRYVLEDNSSLPVNSNHIDDAILLLEGSLFILKRLKKDQPAILKQYELSKSSATSKNNRGLDSPSASPKLHE